MIEGAGELGHGNGSPGDNPHVYRSHNRKLRENTSSIAKFNLAEFTDVADWDETNGTFTIKLYITSIAENTADSKIYTL